MGLKDYRTKRDFRKTPEPTADGARSASKSAKKEAIFVVQEHHARRLHYDFRLEADGVLKSWAVPKEPSMNPADKRLAVHVEDHPLSYASFRGTIPEGQYGAGTVHIWDKGTYTSPQSVTEGIEAGRVEVELRGRRLQGRFVLIRMHGRGRGKDNWLLIKTRDDKAASPNGRTHSRSRRSGSRLTPPAPVRREPDLPLPPPIDELEFTNIDKVMFPDIGVRKGDVLVFYGEIASRLLPYLQDRPATLERLPEGIDTGKKPHFWQKNTPAHYPKWVPRIELPSEDAKKVTYVLVNNLQTLLYLVNQGTLTIHVWLSRVGNLDRPDYVLFDLDPGKAPFGDAVAVAKQLHDVLKTNQIEAYVKTSGKRGLHVFATWTETGGYDEARAWAMEMAKQVVRKLPEQATIERSKAKRGDRVYVDVMQNARGLHAVPPYVLRPIPGAPVSTPLSWRELTPSLDPKAFNIKTILQRLSRQKRDPMAGLLHAFAGAAE